MVAIYGLFAWWLPNYYSVNGIAALLDGAVLTGLVAAGVGAAMIAGEFDLSVGSLAAVAGITCMLTIGMGVVPAIITATIIAAAFGALQGAVIGLLGINSLVLTIGTLIGLRGVALLLSNENTVAVPVGMLADIDVVSDRVLGILSPLSLTLIVVFAAVGTLLAYTRWGREIYAVGGGRGEARAAGVPLLRPLMIAFTLSGGLAGLGGALLSVRSGSASPLGFDAVLLSAATACLMGGVALEGGQGNILGIAIGVLSLRFLITGVGSLGAPFWAQTLAVGALLILVIAQQMTIKSLRRRRIYRVT